MEGPVAVAAGDSDTDAAFVQRLAALLEARNIDSTIASGSPRDVRAVFEELLSGGHKPTLIFTTSESYATIARIKDNLPGLESVPLMPPPSYIWPTFLKTDNLLNVANQITVMAIVAVGMTMVIITGGIDLSVGAVLALCAVAAASSMMRMGLGTLETILLTLSIGLSAGLVNGLVTTRLNLQSFITTLAMLSVARGVASPRTEMARHRLEKS